MAEPDAPAGDPAGDPAAADPGQDGRGPGVREALLVGAGVVAAVLGASAVTFLLPPDVRDVVFRTPLLIGFLVGATAVVLWRITRPPRPDR